MGTNKKEEQHARYPPAYRTHRAQRSSLNRAQPLSTAVAAEVRLHAARQRRRSCSCTHAMDATAFARALVPVAERRAPAAAASSLPGARLAGNPLRSQRSAGLLSPKPPNRRGACVVRAAGEPEGVRRTARQLKRSLDALVRRVGTAMECAQTYSELTCVGRREWTPATASSVQTLRRSLTSSPTRSARQRTRCALEATPGGSARACARHAPTSHAHATGAALLCLVMLAGQQQQQPQRCRCAAGAAAL
jgi:hypothetical protein